MKFTCKKCGATWESDDSLSQGLVQCPECFAVFPVIVARADANAQNEARPTSPTKPQVAPEPPNIHELPTILDAKAENATSAGYLSGDSPTNLGVFPQARGKTAPPLASTPSAGESKPSHASSRYDDKTVIEEPSGVGPQSQLDTEGATILSPPQRPAAPKPSQKSPASAGAPRSATQPRTTHGADLTGVELGGYEIKATLGRGGMGTVYLARQKSLDRDVALKVLPAEMAGNPEFLARFTREALAAAQLTHHNVVQVYDVGSENDTHFIAMEYVRGTNLGEMVRRDGRLNIDDAVGYVVQAARALKYAHDHGIIHRDIKPDNLLLNDLGVVKVADLGLAKFEHPRIESESGSSSSSDKQALSKVAASDITLKAVAMGTPAYMAPEQARDAANVDARADQYALGCTLYYLVTGSPPFSGTTAYEIITKQLNEPVPPLETHVRGVPQTLKVIIQRMLAKSPEDRYADMGEVIRDLEAYLGIESDKGIFRPREIHLAILEEAQKRYYGAPTRRLQKLVPKVFAGAAAILALLTFVLGAPRIGLFFLLTLALTPVLTVLVDGLISRSYFLRRLRSAAFGMALIDWVKTIFAGALAIAGTFQVGLFLTVVASLLVSLALAIGYEFGVLRRLRAERVQVLKDLIKMLKELRVRGMPEEAVQDFVARFAGEEWEELFEDLFGYEALVLARGKVTAAEQVQRRKHYAPWRDPIIRWLDEIERRRREAREVKQLAKVEAKRLAAQGMSEEEAQRKAQDAATVILTEIKTTVGAKDRVKYEDPFAKKRKSGLVRMGLVGTPFRLGRAILGLAMMLPFLRAWLGDRLPGGAFIAAAMGRLPLPEETRALLLSYVGLGCAVALLVSATSRRLVGPALIVLGVAMVVLPRVAQSALAMLPVAIPALWVGVVLIVFGYALCALGAMRGSSF
ncbi:MAG: protein kinase domain-containing protein [Candidatus Sumerlaeaceae bacterium]